MLIERLIAISLVRQVLKNNEFEFNNYYLQIQGTAMGTKMAAAYANLWESLKKNLKNMANHNVMEITPQP